MRSRIPVEQSQFTRLSSLVKVGLASGTSTAPISICELIGQSAILLFRFSVYDLDNETATLADDDFLGQLECTLGEVRMWMGEGVEG